MSTTQSRKKYKQVIKHTDKIGKYAHTRKQQKIKKVDEKRKKKKPRRRIFPIWVRIIVLLIFSCVALIGGLMVGYGILGDGVPRDALKVETWQHILDIVKKKE